MKKYILPVSAACFLVASVLWVYKINFVDKPAVPYKTPQLAGEVQVATTLAGQMIVDGGRIVKFRWPAGNNYQPFVIEIPVGNEPLVSIRFDPASEGFGTLRLQNLRFVDSAGRMQPIPAEDWELLNAQADVKVDGGALTITHQKPEQYPVFLLKTAGPLDTAVDGYPRVSRAGFWMVLAVCGLFALMLLYKVLSVWWLAPVNERWIFAGCFLLLVGFRGLTIHHFGFSSAFWDYWQFPWTVYFPFEDGTLSWKSLFSPVNEHRIFFSRISSLACYLFNGQWDNKFEAALNSIFLSCVALGLALALWKACGKRFALLICGMCVVCFSFPFAWENTVWANQSQFYFYLGGSFLVFWLLGFSRPFSTQWWLGSAAAFWIMFSVGSGMMAVVTVVGLSVYRLLRFWKEWRTVLPTLLAGGAIAGLNLPFMVNQHNYGMQSKNVEQFLATFGKAMSWPFLNNPWLWVLLWIPVVVFIIQAFRSRKRPDQQELWTIVLCGWTLLNTLGMGLYRGGFSTGPASRYMDLTAVASLSGCLALVWIFSRERKVVGFMSIAAGVWAAFMSYGVLEVTSNELAGTLAMRMVRQQRSIMNVIAFNQSQNVAVFMNRSDEELPHPDRFALSSYLRSARLKAILPASIRNPIPLEIVSQTEFQTPGVEPPLRVDIIEPSWGSFGHRGNFTVGSLRARLLLPLQYSWLEFPVIHRLGGGFNTSLRVVDQVRGISRSVPSMKEPYAGWRPLVVKAPGRNNLVIDAVDNDNIAWFAFRAPREKSTVSVWSDRLQGRSLWLAWAGALCMVFGGCGLAHHQRERR